MTTFSPSDSILQPDFVPVLTVHASESERALTKIWRLDGTVTPASSPDWFSAGGQRVGDLRGLGALLATLSKQPDRCIIRGTLIDPTQFHAVRRTSRAREGQQPSFKDVPRSWLCLDVDDVPVPPGIVATDATALTSYARTLLPAPFHDVTCIGQLSASTGSPKKRGKFSIHLWFWLAEPLDSQNLRSYFRESGSQVDRSTLKAVQPHYTADPIVEGGSDPIARRLAWVEGSSGTVTLPKIEKPARDALEMREPAEYVRMDPELRARFIHLCETSGVFRSKSGLVKHREARLAYLDVLVNDFWYPASDVESLRALFYQACVGSQDADAETDFEEALEWAERPADERIGAGTLLFEVMEAAKGAGNETLFKEASSIRSARISFGSPTGAQMLAAMPRDNREVETQTAGEAETTGEYEFPVYHGLLGNGRTVNADIVDNVERLLIKERVLIRHNLWTDSVDIKWPGESWRRYSNTDLLRIFTAARISTLAYKVKKDFLADIIRSLAWRAQYDPMRELMEDLGGRAPWTFEGYREGVTLDSWFPRVWNIADTPYHRAVGRYLLGSLVRRAILPGCKSDEMVVLIGAQGNGKSTFLRKLAPWEDAYTDSVELGVGPKRILEQTGGKSVVEIGEMANATRAEVEHIKRMVSALVDEDRLAYDRETTSRPRRFIMAGTANLTQIFRDGTGSRRFLPVSVEGYETGEVDDEGNKIRHADLGFLARVKPYLYHLAMNELRDTRTDFRLPPHLWGEAAKAQRTSTALTSVEDIVEATLGEEPTAAEEFIKSADILEYTRSFGKISSEHFHRMMTRLGFASERMQIDGARLRVWKRGAETKKGAVRWLLLNGKLHRTTLDIKAPGT